MPYPMMDMAAPSAISIVMPAQPRRDTPPARLGSTHAMKHATWIGRAWLGRRAYPSGGTGASRYSR